MTRWALPNHGNCLMKKMKSDLMHGVSFDNDNVIINLNIKFYPVEFILKAAQSFSESCWVNMGDCTDDVMKLSLKPKSDDIDLNTVGYEFVNFVLGLVKTKNIEPEGTIQNPI